MTKRDREWKCFVSDMIEFCGKVMANSSNTERSYFVDDSNLYDATIWNIVKIGEAATKVPEEIRADFPDIHWQQIISMRNQLIHGYFSSRDDIIWQTISEDIPELRDELLELLNRVEEGKSNH